MTDDERRKLAMAATPGPWELWEGPAFGGGGADLCIGAGADEWVANMDHRYGPDYYSRVQHREHDAFPDPPPDCAICSIDAAVTDEQRANAEYLAALGPDVMLVMLDRLKALKEWVNGADHQRGCSGEWSGYECKCGLKALREKEGLHD